MPHKHIEFEKQSSESIANKLLKEFNLLDERGKEVMLIAIKTISLLNELKILDKDERAVLIKCLINKFFESWDA